MWVRHLRAMQAERLDDLRKVAAAGRRRMEQVPQDVVMRGDMRWFRSDGEHASRCRQCGASFTVFRRKHHCRLCGDLVCHRCSPYELGPLPRVCRCCMALRRGAVLSLPMSYLDLHGTWADSSPEAEAARTPDERRRAGFIRDAARALFSPLPWPEAPELDRP